MSAELPESASQPRRCPNCGAPADGRYCPACGQDNGLARLEVRPMFLEAFQNFIGWESSLVRTLKGLALDPGAMVAEYVAGRRRRFVNPARFALLTLAAWMVLARILKIDPMELGNFQMTVTSGGDQRVALRIRELLSQNLDLFLYATLPLQAVLLKLFFRRSGRNLAENLVLVLYLAGFGWILVLLGAPFFALGWPEGRKLLAVVSLIWFVRATRGFFQRSWLAAIRGTVLVLIFHVLAMGVVGIGTAFAWVRWVES
jgi:hypothetical protein